MKPGIVYMRVTAMMMVVFYHCVCFYTRQWNYGELYIPEWQFVASFLNYIDMPVFVFISGYLYAYMKFEKGKYDDSRLFLKEKTKRLILPYVVWTVINICLIPSTFDVAKILRGYSHLWFLMMLMMVFIIVTVTQWLWTRIRLTRFIAFIGLLSVISLIFNMLKVDMCWFCVDRTFRFLPYFFLGLMMGSYKFIENTGWNSLEKHKKLIMLISLIIVFLISWNNAVEWNFKGSYYLYSMLVYGAVSALLVIVFVSLSHKTSSRHIAEVWLSLDRCSMGIYIVHHILVVYLLQYREVKDFMVCHYVLMPFLLFFLLLLISWGIVVLIRKTALKKLV